MAAVLTLTILSQLMAWAGPSNDPANNPAKYPEHWWKPAPVEGKPAWEILPQEAGPGEVILSKRNELGKLSNFAATPFVLRDKKYASIEGFWQMMLYPEGTDDPRAKSTLVTWKHTRDEVSRMTAFKAKAAGELAEENMQKLGIDWVSFEGRRMTYRATVPGEHYRVIVEAMWAKICQNPEIKKILLLTGKLVLRPDHHQEADAPPEWNYNVIWMQIRDELRKIPENEIPPKCRATAAE